jgi:hypothetical protein
VPDPTQMPNARRDDDDAEAMARGRGSGSKLAAMVNCFRGMRAWVREQKMLWWTLLGLALA